MSRTTCCPPPQKPPSALLTVTTHAPPSALAVPIRPPRLPLCSQSWCVDYPAQQDAVRALVKKEFAHASIDFVLVQPQSERKGLGGNLANVMKLITTKYVYVIQDDFVHNMHFNIHEVLDTFEVNPAIEYVRLNVNPNGKKGLWDFRSDETIIGNGKQCVPAGLTRGCNWSDNNHFVPTSAYHKILNSLKLKSDAPEAAFPHGAGDCAGQMKWYLYGKLQHDPMVCHVDGMYRPWNNNRNGPQKRKCPTEEEYATYLAKQCPHSGLLL